MSSLRRGVNLGLRGVFSTLGKEGSSLSSTVASSPSSFAASAGQSSTTAGFVKSAANVGSSGSFAASGAGYSSASRVAEAAADIAKATAAPVFDGRLRPIPNGFAKSYWRPIPFHLVDMSAYPLLAGTSAGLVAAGLVNWMHGGPGGGLPLVGALTLVSGVAASWFNTVTKEAAIGHHVEIVRNMLRLGVKLFIVSEVCLFASFFWGWFHSALNPTIWIGNVWPPRGVQVPDALGLPLAMTLTLFASGMSANWAQLAMKTRMPNLPGGYDRGAVTKGLGTAIGLGLFFLGLQVYEYINTAFCISDSAFGTCFYMATGLHGLHVVIGVGLLAVTLLRHLRGHFTPWQHVGFESAIWYWQFVDIVWIVLYGAVYLWGGSGIEGITIPAKAPVAAGHH